MFKFEKFCQKISSTGQKLHLRLYGVIWVSNSLFFNAFKTSEHFNNNVLRAEFLDFLHNFLGFLQNLVSVFETYHEAV